MFCFQIETFSFMWTIFRATDQHFDNGHRNVFYTSLLQRSCGISLFVQCYIFYKIVNTVVYICKVNQQNRRKMMKNIK